MDSWVTLSENLFFVEIYGFQVRFSLPGSDNGSRRCSCSGTIGALASVVLLFLNVRPVVSDGNVT